jgi:hypothetical protein
MKRTVLLLATIVAALLVPTGVAWAASVIFTQGQNVGAGEGPNSVTSADFNGDSERDLAVLYGPRLEGVDGHDYDPSRDYVCDRVDA